MTFSPVYIQISALLFHVGSSHFTLINWEQGEMSYDGKKGEENVRTP